MYGGIAKRPSVKYMLIKNRCMGNSRLQSSKCNYVRFDWLSDGKGISAVRKTGVCREKAIAGYGIQMTYKSFDRLSI